MTLERKTDTAHSREAEWKRIDGAIREKLYDPDISFLYQIYTNEGLQNFELDVMSIIPSQLAEPLAYTTKAYVGRALPVNIFGIAKGLQVEDKASRQIAGSINTLMTLSYIIDDIEDGDTERDGQPSAWKRYGTEVATDSFNVGYAALLINLRDSCSLEVAAICREDCKRAVQSMQEQKNSLLSLH